MKYPFRVFRTQVEEHIFWVAESLSLKGCVGQGETSEAACSELAGNEIEWLEAAKECGIPIPDIPFEHMTEYSGKFTVRVAAYVHKEASENAKKNGVSLNQYVNDAIVAQNARQDTIGYIFPEFRNAVNQFKAMVFDTTATVSEGLTSIITISGSPPQPRYKVSVIRS